MKQRRENIPGLFDNLPEDSPPAIQNVSMPVSPDGDAAAPEAEPPRRCEKLTDQADRDRIRDELDTTFVVEAAAGTGKTTELVRRVVSVIASGRAPLNEIVAVTFTDAAAGELKLRLRAEIEHRRQSSNTSIEQESRLTDALAQLEEARIGTIHSFCGDLLRERPVQAGIDPRFEVAAEDTSGPLFELAFDRWFESQLGNPSEAVRRILRRRPRREYARGRPASLARRPRGDGPRKRLRAAALELREYRDFPAPWRRETDFNREREIDELLVEMQNLASWADRGDRQQWFTKSLLELKHFVADITRTEPLNGRDYDGIEARLFDFLSGWRSKNYSAYYTRDDFPAAELKERREALKDKVQRFVDRAGADLAPRLRDDLWPVLEEYARLKERAGCLDFVDLLLRARDLVRDNRAVREELQHRFTHIFVDEFQDTDPLQAEILLLLSADDPAETEWRNAKPVSGKLFVVGDPKQSIYRFRRADVALYDQVKDQVSRAGGGVLNLRVSFRSVPEIQTAVNAAFSRAMSVRTDGRKADYVALEPFRESLESQPAVVALPVPKPFSPFGKLALWQIAKSEPDGVAAFADWLVQKSGWTISRGENGKREPIQPRDICILFRRFRSFGEDVTRPYVRALEVRRLPHLLVGGSGFHAREEIEATRNALLAIERPDDELAVFATLRGPLFGITDGELLAYRAASAVLHPFKRPPEDLPEGLSDVAAALAVLRELHYRRNRRPIADTIGQLLSATRAHAGFANWSTGEQALANVSRLMDMARRTERGGLISFRSFVDWLVDQAETGDASDAPIIEEGLDGIRIMTVHKAKGLEFPVVILADMTANQARDASRWTDPQRGLCAMMLAGCSPPELLENADIERLRDLEEAVRVQYVAATRARDLLVVSAVGDQRYDDRWLSALNPAIFPPPDRSFRPETSKPAGCPGFGQDNCLRPGGTFRPAGSVSPGLHRPEAGVHTVVWWDPSTLELGKEMDVGSRLNKLIAADQAGVRSQAGIEAHARWQESRATTRATAQAPSITVMTATEYARAASSDEQHSAQTYIATLQTSEVTVERIGVDYSRPHGKRFGILVHAVLATVDLNADLAAVQAAAELQSRLLGASPQELSAAATVVHRALAHPLLRRAAEAQAGGHCRRESAISTRLEDGTIVEGIVDLAYLDPDSQVWTVVDFKTDFELEGRLHEYEKQVGIYADTIARATGLRARAVLLSL